MAQNDCPSREDKLRIIQEFVPGRQITIAHVIANPEDSLYEKTGMESTNTRSAMGIVIMTPSDTAIIASDIAMKTSGVALSSLDRVNGTLIVTGSVSQVEAALTAIVEFAEKKLGFSVCEITRT